MSQYSLAADRSVPHVSSRWAAHPDPARCLSAAQVTGARRKPPRQRRRLWWGPPPSLLPPHSSATVGSARRWHVHRWGADTYKGPCSAVQAQPTFDGGAPGVFFIFIFFENIFYRNIFSISQFTVLYPYRPAGGRPGACRPARGRQ